MNRLRERLLFSFKNLFISVFRVTAKRKKNQCTLKWSKLTVHAFTLSTRVSEEDECAGHLKSYCHTQQKTNKTHTQKKQPKKKKNKEIDSGSHCDHNKKINTIWGSILAQKTTTVYFYSVQTTIRNSCALCHNLCAEPRLMVCREATGFVVPQCFRKSKS